VNLSRDAMLEVMAYVDGELEGEALDRVESLLATDEDASRLALELRTLGDCVRVIQTDRDATKNPDQIADDVMAAIDKNVVAIAPLAIRRRNAYIAGSFSAVLAVAAVWMLFFRGGPAREAPTATADSVHVTVPAPVVTASPVVPEQITAQADPEDRAGVDVEAVESPSHEVSVFYVPTTASANPNASSVVVWIGEGEASK